MESPHPALLGAAAALAVTKNGRRLLVLGIAGAAVFVGMRRRGASWHEVPPPSSAP